MFEGKYETIRKILTFIKNEKIEIYEYELKRLKNPEFARTTYPLATKEYLILLDQLEWVLGKDVLSKIELYKLRKKLEKKELRDVIIDPKIKQMLLNEAL